MLFSGSKTFRLHIKSKLNWFNFTFLMLFYFRRMFKGQFGGMTDWFGHVTIKISLVSNSIGYYLFN
jgi:hypothetical protein